MSAEAFLAAEYGVQAIFEKADAHFFDEYIESKKHEMTAKRVITFLSQSAQLGYLPGDPGEDDYDGVSPEWKQEDEPVPAQIDLWTRSFIPSKPQSR